MDTKTQYYRLKNDNGNIFFARTVTEFLPPGVDKWQMKPVDYDPEETINLGSTGAPVGIATLKRRPFKES